MWYTTVIKMQQSAKHIELQIDNWETKVSQFQIFSQNKFDKFSYTATVTKLVLQNRSYITTVYTATGRTSNLCCFSDPLKGSWLKVSRSLKAHDLIGILKKRNIVVSNANMSPSSMPVIKSQDFEHVLRVEDIRWKRGKLALMTIHCLGCTDTTPHIPEAQVFRFRV